MRLPAILALILLCASAAPVAFAAGSTEEVKQHWVDRWNTLHAQQAELSAELASARADYRRGRRANRGRGEERVELLATIARLEKELSGVEQALAAFPEEARRAGALPGWFRDTGRVAKDPSPAPPAATPAP